MIKLYVEQYFPGFMFAETSVKEVDSIGSFKPDENAFGYRFFEVIEANVDGVICKSNRMNYSNKYYIGTLIKIEDVDPNSVLYSNMRSNRWYSCVKTKHGQYFPLERGDRVGSYIEKRG